jgi:hypothetical protein
VDGGKRQEVHAVNTMTSHDSLMANARHVFDPKVVDPNGEVAGEFVRWRTCRYKGPYNTIITTTA